ATVALECVFPRPVIGTFILLSGDSDFSSLVLKLKEYGKYVIGVGIRESSSDLLIQNCDEYYSYNELAGFTKESDITHERHDPWDLVIEAVKQMTAHNDVMRSDRLKQVMQEIDPAFNEKDVGFSRFSKFVIEAAHKGLINLTKLDNGQYEIALGPGVPGAAAQPAGVAAPDRARERSEGRGRGRGRRGGGVGGGGGGRDEQEARVEPAAADEPAPEQRRSAFSGAFGDIKQALGRLARGGHRCRRSARSPHARVVGAAVDAAGCLADRRYSVAQRAVPPRVAGPARQSARHSQDRGGRSRPQLQAADRAAAPQAVRGRAPQRRHDSGWISLRGRRASRARGTRRRRWPGAGRGAGGGRAGPGTRGARRRRRPPR